MPAIWAAGSGSGLASAQARIPPVEVPAMRSVSSATRRPVRRSTSASTSAGIRPRIPPPSIARMRMRHENTTGQPATPRRVAASGGPRHLRPTTEGVRMHVRMRLAVLAGLVALAAVPAGATAAPDPADGLVTSGSPSINFSQNKQNEPAVAVNPVDASQIAAGANEEIDEEACNAGDPETCPFTDGVGVSGIYFSSDGFSWTQPTYQGFTARDCLGPAACDPHPGAIGTLPNYFENGLVSDGDPALVYGPRRGANGSFAWANGQRLYYANLTSNFPGRQAFRGAEAIAVSHTDDNGATWSDPTIVSRQSSATFSDKEQIWADNAS